uniref:Putative transfer protein n=1 Tax=Stenotrophomonas maltophilia TaxID=40324 RepID=Q7WZN2_STEMA|nr:putative transfer protein [Stenotrophomonas maltophilia]
MIAKRIPRDRATSNMAKLVRYVVDAQGREDPRSWTNTAEYILATRSNGEKVGGMRVSNCHSTEPVAATLEILATQALNTRSKADKTYHLVFSFPPGEQPPMAVLHAIEDELCAAIGMADHQRISAVHIDTDHLHVHVAINKVHPKTYRNFEPFYDHKRLMEACDRLEVKHGLQPTNHGRQQLHEKRLQQQQERTNERYRDRDRARGAGRLPPPGNDRWSELAGLRESDLAFDPRRHAPGQLHSLPNVSSLRMVRVTRGGDVLLQNNARDNVHAGKPAGIEVLRRAGDGVGRAEGKDDGRDGVRPTARVASMEAYTGEDSMQTWVRKHALEDLKSAASWEQVHRVVGELGLELKLRGAGLTIYDPAARIGIRPSSVDRSLSMKSLSDRLGQFTPSAHSVAPGKGYSRSPRSPGLDSSGLYTEYQRHRDNQQAQRRSALDAINKQGAAKLEHARAVHAAKRKALKLIGGIPRHAKQISYQALRMEHQANVAAIRAELAKARKTAVQSNVAPSWDDFVRQRAATGDQDALALMRARANRLIKTHLDLLTAPDAEKARAIVFKHLKPRVARSGEIHYKTSDGGLVIDRGGEVRSVKSTATAAFIALSLAAAKFPGQPLVVEGTEEFRLQVAELAGTKAVQVRFADAGMEAHRQQAAKASADRAAALAKQAKPQPSNTVAATPNQAAGPAPTVQPSPDSGQQPTSKPTKVGQVADGSIGDAVLKTGAKETPSPAVIKWVAQRNNTAHRVSDIDYTRLWVSTDAGEATYQGRRRMEDGSEVVLLGRQGQTLVKPVTAAVAAKASRFKVGQAVVLDERGRFVDTSRGRRR